MSEDLRERLAHTEERLEQLQQRERHFVAAQRISHVGSYDFDIAANSNVWSDQLYRIYGHEPGAFHATYEKFLELVHPDDRETVLAVHQQALSTMSPYEMEERIVWPDGQVRTLASWGEVVPGPDGKPARMVGICWDVTEQRESAAALKRSSERFEALVRSAPDMVLVASPDGIVIRANERVRDVLSHSPEELTGRPVQSLLPAGLRPGETTAIHSDGRSVPVDISTSEVYVDDALVTVAFVRDITDRKEHERLAMRLHDNDVRRRHALEINDNVVQGLTSVLYLLDLERHAAAHDAARTTLAAARGMMSGLLTEADAPLVPGDLVRERGHVGTLDTIEVPEATPIPGALRVLLADDASDIRLLLRLALSAATGFDVVGEATNGAEAVELTSSLQPDVVLLDLSMPVMDGLQAIPELLRVSSTSRIVVLSGFDEGRMKQAALDLGAHAYVEKGEASSVLVATLARLFPLHPLPVVTPPPPPADPDTSGLLFDGEMMVHELRTPLTVITGMLATLRDRMDVLPSATTAELIDAALRNAGQMAELLSALSDARRASHGQLSVSPEPTDIGELVRSSVSDLCAGHGWRAPVISAPEDVFADVDPVRLRQALANLLSNAYKFAPPGSAVTVTVSGLGDRVEIAVADGGPGVPEQRRDELFQKFSRLGADGPGMGLGLFISRAIARAHGGDLTLDEGPGGRFCLSLPTKVMAS